MKRPDEHALRLMREHEGEGVRWAAYENLELGHPGLGHLQFLRVGKGCTFETPPKRMPDTPGQINWRYWRVGWVNLETGLIEDLTEDELRAQRKDDTEEERTAK